VEASTQTRKGVDATTFQLPRPVRTNRAPKPLGETAFSSRNWRTEMSDAPVKVTVVTEGGRTTYTFENGDAATVGALIREAGPSLNISSDSTIAVNGESASLDTPLSEDDEVSTTKPAGRKGV
jgi:molybdopterin converting factor small subunit